MPEVTWAGAALAGLLSFLSPCILPIVPFYLSYMAGTGMAQISDGGRSAARSAPPCGDLGKFLCRRNPDHLHGARRLGLGFRAC